ncbi:hypothetical protein C4B63_44g113 [Trypanosoma cruzi]|uniref:Uncharacterized protein n=1 Tax=Trypanosoma cruzi TaxID=5693 RepID=A0A2V2V8B1_TRYCR|nr:hypothetical protein C4B63_44g113 [Trypanosoma cruzi]
MMEPAGDRPVLAEIVERHTGGNSNIATTTATSGDDNNGVLCSLRPIQAVVGRPFPRFHPDRFYGRQTMDERSRIGLTGTAGGATTAGPAHGFTAHVQPTTSNGAGNITDHIGTGSYDGAGAIASMARQHQWEAQEFEGLERGYYTVPLHPPVQMRRQRRTNCPSLCKARHTWSFYCGFCVVPSESTASVPHPL